MKQSKILIVILILVSVFTQPSNAQMTKTRKIFISFSMPEKLLEQVAHEAASLHIPLVLNGMHHHSMRETLNKIFSLVKKDKNVSIQLDPLSFEKYEIKRVPTLVIDDGQSKDVIRGNMKIKDMLELIDKHGETRA